MNDGNAKDNNIKDKEIKVRTHNHVERRQRRKIAVFDPHSGRYIFFWKKKKKKDCEVTNISDC